MQSTASTPQEYFDSLPEDRKKGMNQLRKVILDNLPEGLSEEISYGMIGYVLPHSIYPAGYHCNPTLPLPFMSLASQKNFIAFYHMGLYADEKTMDWFLEEYPKHTTAKKDMGKSCLRFKNPEQIPFELIGQLVKRISVKEWIEIYETKIKK